MDKVSDMSSGGTTTAVFSSSESCIACMMHYYTCTTVNIWLLLSCSTRDCSTAVLPTFVRPLVSIAETKEDFALLVFSLRP